MVQRRIDFGAVAAEWMQRLADMPDFDELPYAVMRVGDARDPGGLLCDMFAERQAIQWQRAGNEWAFGGEVLYPPEVVLAWAGIPHLFMADAIEQWDRAVRVRNAGQQIGASPYQYFERWARRNLENYRREAEGTDGPALNGNGAYAGKRKSEASPLLAMSSHAERRPRGRIS